MRIRVCLVSRPEYNFLCSKFLKWNLKLWVNECQHMHTKKRRSFCIIAFVSGTYEVWGMVFLSVLNYLSFRVFARCTHIRSRLLSPFLYTSIYSISFHSFSLPCVILSHFTFFLLSHLSISLLLFLPMFLFSTFFIFSLVFISIFSPYLRSLPTF